MTNYIPLYYYLSNNFGDNLSHYLTKKISGKEPILLDANDSSIKYMVTGSILNNNVKNAISWGCGVAYSNNNIPKDKQIVAVRGRMTGKLCDNNNVHYEKVYGDPALLLPRYYTPKSDKKYKLGIIPHYVDAKIVFNHLNPNYELEKLGIKIINVLDDVETVVDSINECEKTISSSLHGIIVSHAYGIPCLWTKFSNLIGGDDFKFLDYFSTTNIQDKNYYDLRSGFSINTIVNFMQNTNIQKVSITEDLDLLFNNCPFK